MRETLRAYSLGAAQAKSQPAFCVFSDKVLNAIVDAVPRSSADLSRIKGLGPAKIAEHGEAILSICSGGVPTTPSAQALLACAATPSTLGKRPAAQHPDQELRARLSALASPPSQPASYHVASGVRLSVPGRPVVTVGSGSGPISRGYGGGVDLAAHAQPLGRPNDEQSRIIDLVVRQRKSVFITGSAGTGKSFILKHIQRQLSAVLPAGALHLTAPTGIAAINIGGSTIHSFAGVGLAR
jgi:Cdc6-like AAA superfamily ATPase